MDSFIQFSICGHNFNFFPNFDSWPKFRFLENESIFEENFGQNVYRWQRCIFLYIPVGRWGLKYYILWLWDYIQKYWVVFFVNLIFYQIKPFTIGFIIMSDIPLFRTALRAWELRAFSGKKYVLYNIYNLYFSIHFLNPYSYSNGSRIYFHFDNAGFFVCGKFFTKFLSELYEKISIIYKWRRFFFKTVQNLTPSMILMTSCISF